MISDQTRRQKSRDVGSRYLSPQPQPQPLASPSSNRQNQNQNPKPSSSTKHKHKHKHTGFIRGLWPSSTTPSSKSHHEISPPPNATVPITLADHLGTERRKDGVKRSVYSPFLSKQKSCSEFGRWETSKEHHTPIYGIGSKRYTGKLIPGRSSISSSTSSSSSSKSSNLCDSNQVILPGRLSVDENALRRRSPYTYFQTRSDSLSDNSESSDLGSPFTTGKNYPASYMAPTLSSRKSGVEVPSKYMNPSIPMQNSPKISSTHFKTALKRANSVTSPLEWESSPSRFSSSKPPASPPKGKKNLLHMGLDLIKLGKKGGLKSHSDSDTGTVTMENVHQLRLLQNSWMQWRYANARAEAVQYNLGAQCQNDLLFAKESMEKLQHSVLQKRLQLQKERLDMKLNMILHSQIKILETWGDIERRHVVDVSTMKDYLHAVVCMIPLIQGAKVDLESTSIAFQHTSELVSTIKSKLSLFSPMDHETIARLSELAEVATQEKSLLEECFEHLRVISMLEIQERNLRCSIIASMHGLVAAACNKNNVP